MTRKLRGNRDQGSLYTHKYIDVNMCIYIYVHILLCSLQKPRKVLVLLTVLLGLGCGVGDWSSRVKGEVVA